MTAEQLEKLNAVLAETPTVNRYSNDEIQPLKRMRLEATLVVRTRTYDVPKA